MKTYITLALFYLISSLAFATEPTTVYLVRHTEKDLTQKQDPPLTEIGTQRAQYWASVLRDVKLDAVYSTDTSRTRDTAEPSAVNNLLQTILYKPGELDRETLKRHAGKNVLIVGHSNTTPKLVNRLIGENFYPDLDEKDYSTLFVVTLGEHSTGSQKLSIELPPVGHQAAKD